MHVEHLGGLEISGCLIVKLYEKLLSKEKKHKLIKENKKGGHPKEACGRRWRAKQNNLKISIVARPLQKLVRILNPHLRN